MAALMLASGEMFSTRPQHAGGFGHELAHIVEVVRRNQFDQPGEAAALGMGRLVA